MRSPKWPGQLASTLEGLASGRPYIMTLIGMTHHSPSNIRYLRVGPQWSPAFLRGLRRHWGLEGGAEGGAEGDQGHPESRSSTPPMHRPPSPFLRLIPKRKFQGEKGR